MALIAWRETGDQFFLDQTLLLAPHYARKVTEDRENTMHDLGFLYSLYSVALFRLSGDRSHRETALRAAETLADRFVPVGGYIQAWGRMDTKDSNFIGLAIIDSMMNLPLLYWAADETENPHFREIAKSHADRTLEHFVRTDGSLYHAFRFDRESGSPSRGENFCGYGVESHWARGTAWAVYGFSLSYRYTREDRYLEVALRLARKFVSYLDDDLVPVWDFRLLLNKPVARDSSAAAIMICAIQELERLDRSEKVLSHAKRGMLERLCRPDYLDSDPEIHGIMRNGQIGFGINVFTSWGDYFLMEALSQELNQKETFW